MVMGVIDLVKGKNAKKTEIKVTGDKPKIVTGEHAREIDAETYIEKQVNILPEIKTPLDSLHQLPSPPADFTGREKEIREFTKDIQNGVTISGLQGMGGIGKTALGLVIAHQLKEQYPDGQIFLDLRGADMQEPLTAAEVMSHVLRSFQPEAKLPEEEALLAPLYNAVLQGKKVLLFFDNARGAEQVTPLLPPKGCLTLVTSRQHFNLSGLKAHNLDTLAPKDARSLVRKIAKGVKAEEADAISEKCGYLPLALRLAAGMLNTRPDWTPADLIKKLQDALALLEPVEVSLQLSYGLLDEPMQLHFRELGVFPAPFDKEAVEVIWEVSEEETDKMVGVLLEASLLEYDRDAGKYELHDLVRQYAIKKLCEDERDEQGARLRHAGHYCDVLRAANELYLKGGENILRGLRLFDVEWIHIQAGQAWAMEQIGKEETAAKLCSAYPDAGVYVLDLRLTPRVRITWLNSALSTARELKDKMSEGNHLGNLGLAYAALGDARKAIEFYEKQLVIVREIGDRRGEGNSLGNLGNTLYQLGEKERGIELMKQALAIYAAIESPYAEWARKRLKEWGALD